MTCRKCSKHVEPCEAPPSNNEACSIICPGSVYDTQEDAEELIGILKSRNCHLNLIPVNPIKERDFQQPSRKNALNFKNKLEKSGINVTIRREMGADIDGACGQLRRRYVKTENE